MTKLFILVLLIAAAAVGVVLSGRGGGEDNGLVAIQRLDLRAAAIDEMSIFDPPPANGYPAVVATVNGVAISGDALASRQMVLELTKRQWMQALPDQAPAEFVTRHLKEIDAENPLDYLVDQELERQAVIRLGFTPSEEEATAFAAKNEDMTKQVMRAATATPQAQQQFAKLNAARGLPAENWSSDAVYLDRVKQAVGHTRLRNSICSRPTPTGVLSLDELSSGNDCEAYRDFLEQERANADIVYYVRWVD